MVELPPVIPNWIGGHECVAVSGATFVKNAPADGREFARVVRSRSEDVLVAIQAARKAFPDWADRSPVVRAEVIRQAALLLRERARDLSGLVARETGKSLKDALAETNAAAEMGFFVAGEGRRLYGRTTTSAVPHKMAMIVRQPLGVAGLIVPANTPLPNIAWKIFPALICGNSVVLKSSEDAPVAAWIFGKILHDAGLSEGVVNIVHGMGEEAGAPLVEASAVSVISFTGSVEVGRWIAERCGARMARCCIEAGGKNPLIVCDDADMDAAILAATLSAFSNAGQRCAAASRLLVFDAVYDRFRDGLLDRIKKLRVGVTDDDDVGPVINEESLRRLLDEIAAVKGRGAKVLAGGHRVEGPGYGGGYYLAPTLLEDVPHADPLTSKELFGPVTALYRVRNFDEAIRLANDSPLGLTASIFSRDVHRAMTFLSRIHTGVAVVNGPTYGSEPHMPFGGLRMSGNGRREAGTEALDVYSEWKTLYVNFRPGTD